MSSDFLQVILLLEAACHKLSLHPEDPATREIAVRTLLAFRVDLPAGASAFLRGLAFDIAKQAELLRFSVESPQARSPSFGIDGAQDMCGSRGAEESHPRRVLP